MDGYQFYILGSIAVILIGISKAGFGAGVAHLAVPLFMLAAPGREVLGILLPLLIGCDIVSVCFYRKDWSRWNVAALVPGFIAGVIIGSFFLGSIPDEILKRSVGAIAVGFVLLKVITSLLRQGARQYQPRYWHGNLTGACAGFVSTLAHAAGPIVAMFLLPQRLPKKRYVGTLVVYFMIGNLIKVPPYVILGILNRSALLRALSFAYLIPVGVLAGVWMNRRLPEEPFRWIIYVLLSLTGIQLVSGISIIGLFTG